MDWIHIPLSKIFRLTNGKSISADYSYVRNDEYPFPIYGGNSVLGYARKYLLDDKTIVIGRVGEYCGNVSIAEGKMWISDNALYISEWLKECDIEFMCYLLEYVNFNRYRDATGQPKITQSLLKRIKPLCPENVTEQKAISSILSKVDEAIKATENSIKATEKLKKSLMQNLLTGKLKPDGTWRRKDEFYKDEKFGDVPVGWDVKKVKAVATEIQYGLNSSADENGTIPMFRMNNIIKEKMVADPMVYVQLSSNEKAKYQLQRGDILFNRTNSMELVGKVGIFDLEGEYVFASYLIKISVNSDNNPFFINYVLNSYPIQCSLRSKATPAVSQANINANSLSNTHLVIPQKDEQSLIAEKLKSLEKSMEYKEVKVQRLQRLKKALMQNLLTGKIRVDVNKIKNLLNKEIK